VAFSPDGRQIATGGGEDEIRVWDAARGEQIQTLAAHMRPVRTVAFSPDGRQLAASGDKMVKIWDLATGQETLTLKGHTFGVPCVAFSPDGQRLASAGYDGALRVWDARPWTPELRIEQEARGLIRQLVAKVGHKAEVIRQIEQDPSLSAEVKQEALEMIKRWQEAPR
jgi:WD40 repeat protein